MKTFGLVGWPIAHSLSPMIHNAGFNAEGLYYQYELIPIAPADFEKQIKQTLHQYQGMNVTTPYKTKIMAYLDVCSDTAHNIQAVNTIYHLPDGRLYGDSTDGAGFWQSSGIDVGQTVVLIGCGGAARAIMATKPAGIQLIVLNRKSDRFMEYQGMVTHLTGQVLQTLETFDAWEDADVVIDATSVGLHNDATILDVRQLSRLSGNTKVIDLKYRTTLTPLLALAQLQGLPVLDGRAMLLEQAILSHKQWINAEPNRESMSQAVYTDMQKREG